MRPTLLFFLSSYICPYRIHLFPSGEIPLVRWPVRSQPTPGGVVVHQRSGVGSDHEAVRPVRHEALDT